jgi:ATP-dependent DNA helicase RecG
MSSGDKQKSGLDLSMPVQFLKGVGPAKAKIFAEMGVETAGDLLGYFPRDWVFAPQASKIADIEPEQEVTIKGLVESTDYQGYRKSRIFEAIVADETDACRIVWFHGGYLQKQLEPGMVIMASGKVSIYKHQIQLTNPKFMILKDGSPEPEKFFSGGVYHARGNLSSGRIKKILRPLVEQAQELVDELFDEQFRSRAELIERGKAYKWIHQPEDQKQLKQAKRRLKYDELFLMQLGLALRRYHVRHDCGAEAMRLTEQIDKRIRKRFPFLLTEDQEKVIGEIVSDMSQAVPMNRLLQGDVGSGKTVVALYAALLAVANGKQVAIMAPTEVLANQHFISIERYLKGSRVRRALITGGMTGLKRKELLAEVRRGQIDIVVGTVALLQSDIEFKDLGFVVIDEQHKFGVEQRGKLRQKVRPHCLVMTATPIPRTLAMTAFGDLDVSLIKHRPPGRGTVITRWVDKKDRLKAFDFIRERLRAKRQAFFVYPRINSSDEDSDVKAAVEEYERLSKEVFSEYRVELLHGRMQSQQKSEVMDSFRKGRIDVLVSTVVIEVGVDVPNATIMVIEGADRFGLAQLHQLRGRIGRGEAKSYCLLFCESESEAARERLEVMERTNDGFEIAEHDLRLRGPGEMFSTRQHGLPDLKIANIIDDYDLLMMARKDAFEMVESDPYLTAEKHKNIRRALISRFGDSLGLVDVA